MVCCVWDEKYTFNGPFNENDDRVCIAVFDYQDGTLEDKKIGFIEVKLSEIKLGEKDDVEEQWYPLHNGGRVQLAFNYFQDRARIDTMKERCLGASDALTAAQEELEAQNQSESKGAKIRVTDEEVFVAKAAQAEQEAAKAVALYEEVCGASGTSG